MFPKIYRLVSGASNARTRQELDDRLRCSICEDREKNTVFACGHSYCDECATQWKQCPLRCTSHHGQKPVKHRFPLYL